MGGCSCCCWFRVGGSGRMKAEVRREWRRRVKRMNMMLLFSS